MTTARRPVVIGRQFATYAALGGIGALSDFVAFTVLIYFGVPAVPANMCSVSLGIVVSYALNSRVTFSGASGRRFALVWFYAVGLLGLAVSSTAIWLLVEVAGVPPMIAKAIILPTVALLQFTLNRNWTFGARRESSVEEAGLEVSGSGAERAGHPAPSERAHLAADASDADAGPVVVVGAGFTGLAAGYELARHGAAVRLFEATDTVGGLAAAFSIDGHQLDRFYHHWFRGDTYAIELIAELGLTDMLRWRATNTGLFYNRTSYRLSSPLDVLRFSALPLRDRLRLGMMVVRARRLRDWRSIEHLTAKSWIERLAGPRVYEVVWEPLLKGKFGPYADQVGAVWFWKKIVLRGSSRSRRGAESLGYLNGGFQGLADRLAGRITQLGGAITTGVEVQRIVVEGRRVIGVVTTDDFVPASAVLLAVPLPEAIRLMEGSVDPSALGQMGTIEHLANICLILELDRSLSSTYWLNVNDPAFPFVGVIEHTNFQPPAEYGDRRVVYLSTYLPRESPLWAMEDDELLAFAIPHLRRMFPEFSAEWVLAHRVWRAAYSQPVVGPDYSRRRPPYQAPGVDGLFLATMAHIYPEDRGTNYAIRDGRMVARMIARPDDSSVD